MVIESIFYSRHLNKACKVTSGPAELDERLGYPVVLVKDLPPRTGRGSDQLSALFRGRMGGGEPASRTFAAGPAATASPDDSAQDTAERRRL